MRKSLLVLVVALALGATTRAADIAFYIGVPNTDGWYDMAAQTKDVATIISMTGYLFGDIQKFDDTHLKELGDWVDKRTNDGKMDILWLNGTMPSVLYPNPNLQPDGSRIEKWIDGGNMIINVADWFGYCTYEGGARGADNGGAGAANILDLSSGIIVSADGTNLQVTPAGRKYLPSLNSPAPTSRPIAVGQVRDPWEVAAIFASTGGTEAPAEAQADPIVIHNKVTGAYVAFINQGGTGSWIKDRGLTCAEFIKNWIATVIGLGNPGAAGGANPADKATDVPRDAVLSWTAGMYPSTHDVYLGTTFADVNTASRTDAKGVLASKGQADTTFDPPGSLAYGQTYYWRIDEVNKSPDGMIAKGSVWSFTAESYGYPVKPVKATASSAQASMGPEKTIDGSGLDKSDLHGTEPTTMWMTSGGPPNWIQYEFDKVCKLHQLLVWNSNQLIEGFLGFGAKKVTIETSVDGVTWTALADVPEFAKATGMPGYAANTTVKFGGVNAKFVKLTINTNQGGMAPQTGLAEVRFFCVPVQAFAPQPANAATGVAVDGSLNWRPGREAGSHKVFFGADQAAVAGGTAPAKTVTDHSFSPGSLNLATAYYWKVDEVNTVTYPGDVWNFTTQDYKVVDDFESYTDKAGAEVFSAWIDGLADNYKSNGSTVGLDTAAGGTFCNTTTVYAGKQSMPFAYDKTKAAVSEATRTFAPAQDWTASGIKTLVLFFYGDAANTGTELYVKINDTKVLYAGKASDLARRRWNQWNVDLSALPAATLRSVKTLTIGVAGGTGKLLIDEVRLYRIAPEIPAAVDPGKTGLVGYYAMSNNVQDSSGSGNNGTVVGAPTYVAGLPAFGTALKLNGTSDCVDLGKKPVFNFAGSFSLSVWANIGAWTSNWNHVMVGNRGEDNIGWQLRRRDSNKICFTTRTVGTDDLGSTMNAPLDEWVHIAAVYDNTANTKRIYVNGVQDAFAATNPGKVPATTHNTYIGCRANSGNTGREGYFTGMLDEVRLYSRALSAGEVEFLSNPAP